MPLNQKVYPNDKVKDGEEMGQKAWLQAGQDQDQKGQTTGSHRLPSTSILGKPGQ